MSRSVGGVGCKYDFSVLEGGWQITFAQIKFFWGVIFNWKLAGGQYDPSSPLPS